MNTPFIFFGTPEFSTYTLNALEKEGLVPSVIITAPDSPQGRGLVLTPSPVKLWALERNIPVYTPEKIRNNEEIHSLCKQYEFAILAAYGKIIPQFLLDCFPKGILNVHPSLLPLYRGPSPLEYQILQDEKEFGVTIIKLDSECDHGPIVAQREILFSDTPSKEELGQKGFTEGGKLIAQYVGPYLSGVLPTLEQNHTLATHTQKIEKKDGEILPTDTERQKYLKYLAYQPWPGTFFFLDHDGKKIRLKITQAKFEDNTFVIERVIPEGKKEMLHSDFLRGLQ
ncbi:MAG: methionyl-tRNA formyltransferase [Minisyncoccia bacterium]